MKTLSTLIKLQKTYVDEQRQHLTTLLDRLEIIEVQIAEIEIRKARELVMAQDDAARATYGAFLTNMVTKGRVLEKERHTAAMAVKIAKDKLAELFEEQKRYELAEAQRLEREVRIEQRRETNNLDEIGAGIHERKRGEER